MVLVDYPNIGGQYINNQVRKETRNILHESIDVHSRRIIDEFPGDGENVFPIFNHIVKT